MQWFPTARLKIEPWFINGWQSYARPNGKPGLGGQILYMPKPWLYLVFNNYGLGEDDPGYPGRSRFHADYSTEIKYYDHPERFIDKMAMTLTGDAGCEYGGGPPVGTYSANGISPEMGISSTYTGGVNCHNDHNGRPKQSFLGWMGYDRLWFKKDLYAMTIGGGEMNNPGRYLTLLPPINKATAVTGSPYFTENPGDRSKMLDATLTFDYTPRQFITFRLEEGYRYAFIPYWTGRNGITPPGGDNGNPSDYQCAAGGDSGCGYVFTNYSGSVPVSSPGQPLAIANCINLGLSNGYTGQKALWWPDLRQQQIVSTLAIWVRF
jgi:Putative beta-barrel porin-2, OmpL-like. bbp2